MKPTTAAVIKAVRTDLRKGKSDVDRLLAGRTEPEFQDPDVRFAQAAQNTLRTCLEATFDEAGGFSGGLCVELAIRLASYAISALPLEEQHNALELVLRSLPSAHKARLSKGVVIRVDWMKNGQVSPNLPEGRA